MNSLNVTQLHFISMFSCSFRGENGPGGYIMRSISDDPNKTEFTWLLNTNLKVNSLFFLFIASISVAST